MIRRNQFEPQPREGSGPGAVSRQDSGLLEALFAEAPIGLAFWDTELRYRRINDVLAAIDGRSVEEHVGRTVREVLGEHGAEAERLVREVMARREPMDVQLRVRTPAAPDRERCLEATYFPVFAPAGLLGVGAVVRDVTDRPAREQAQERERLLRDALSARAQAEAARRRATFLATVTRRLASSMDYEATLREVLSSAVPYLADWGLVSILEPSGRLRLLGFAHRDPEREQLAEEFARRYRPGPGSSVTRVLQTGEPMVVEDVTRERLAEMAREPEYVELLERLGIRHFGTWPISGPDGTAIGTLSLVLGDSGRRFAQDDLQLAQTVATRAGLHLTNARLHTERSEIARTLQDSLLPRKLPVIPGIDLASAFLPAGGENVVGGDFFDVFENGDGVWTAILGDVSGKGAAAAAITAAARHTLRAAALVDPAPAANLALLNRVLVADLRPAEFCTVIQARLCPGEDGLTVRLANGGHPPALILRADGSVESVEAGRGPLVGVVADAEFRETDVELAPDDVLLLYTDGVTEVRPSDLSLGPRELIAALATQRGRSAQDVVEAVTRSALDLQHGAARDDIAVLAIRFRRSGAEPGAAGLADR